MARAGSPESPGTSNLLQFVMSRMLANAESSKTVKPILGAVYEFGLRHGSGGPNECHASGSDDGHQRGRDHCHLVGGQQEAQLCPLPTTRDYGLLGNRWDDIFKVLQAGCRGQTSLRYVEDNGEDQPQPCTPPRLQPLVMGMPTTQ